MIPNPLTSASPPPFSFDPCEDQIQLFFPNYQTASSSSVSVFFNSNQDQTEYYHTLQQHKGEAENLDPYGTGSHDPEKKACSSLRLSLWKNNENQADQENPVNNKWMSSEVNLMQKVEKSDLKEVTSRSTMKFEDQKQLNSVQTDRFSSNSSSNNSNTPIRVCADCNTTKTPLWRSGPKGPKSLCNACGIRQRKARRAMAAAANGTNPAYETAASLKIKMQNKEKIKNNGTHTAQLKKKCKLMTAESSSQTHAQRKNNGFEDFLFNLSKNLAFHHVFPQDEKEAAILLMALSCGLVHG